MPGWAIVRANPHETSARVEVLTAPALSSRSARSRSEEVGSLRSKRYPYTRPVDRGRFHDAIVSPIALMNRRSSSIIGPPVADAMILEIPLFQRLQKRLRRSLGRVECDDVTRVGDDLLLNSFGVGPPRHGGGDIPGTVTVPSDQPERHRCAVGRVGRDE